MRAEFSRQYEGVSDTRLTLMFGSNEDITVMKINTYGGQDAFVYFVQKNPSFFELDKIIYPTGWLNISCLHQSISNTAGTFPIGSYTFSALLSLK